METQVAAALGIVAAVALTGLLSRALGIPAPVLLLLEGVIWALIPVTPNVRLDPDVILTLVLPPLLHSAALDASLIEIRNHVRPIASLSVGLVLFTTIIAGIAVSVVVPGMSIGTGLVLGAIVAPPDAVAALAVGRRVPLPPALATLVEGEGLLNDATALTAYSVAVSAVVQGGGISSGEAVGRFILAGAGGAFAGLAVGWLVRFVRRRLRDSLVENCLSLATPFLAFLPAEELHASGLTAVVVAGLWLGHQDPTLQSGGSRLQTGAVWRLLTFVLEGAVFLLVGLDLHGILDEVSGTSVRSLTEASAVLLAVVLLARPLWIAADGGLDRLRLRARARDRPAMPWRPAVALSWSGMRGVVSLAAAEALPLTIDSGAPFPFRGELLLLAFVVVAVTLVVQGLTLAGLLRVLGLERDDASLREVRAEAEQAAVRAGLSWLEEEAAQTPVDDDVLNRLRLVAERRERAAKERRVPAPAESPTAAWRRLRLSMIAAERAELLRRRDSGDLPDVILRDIQHRLDLEERGLET